MSFSDASTAGDRTLLTDPTVYAILGLGGVGVLSTTLVAPALPSIATSFDLSEAEVGLVMTAFFLTAVVAIPTLGALADVVGRRTVFLSSLLVFGVTGVLAGAVDSFEALLLLRALQGCAFPGLLPMAITVVGDVYDGHEATTAQGLLTSITGLVGVGSPLVAGALVDVSWRLPFFLYGLSFGALLACYHWLPEPESEPAPRPTTTNVESPSVNRISGLQCGFHSVRTRLERFVREVTDALTLEMNVVILSVFVLFLVRFALFTFLPLYAVTVLESSELLGGVAVALLGLGRFVAAPAAGRVTRRFGRVPVVVGSLLLFGGGTWTLLLSTEVWFVLLVVGVASIGDGLFDPLANDFVTTSVPPAVRGRIVSVLEVARTGAIATAPVVAGVVLSWTSFRGLFFAAGFLVVTAALGSGVALSSRFTRS